MAVCSFNPVENALYYIENLTVFRKYEVSSGTDTVFGRMVEILWQDAGLEGVYAKRLFITLGNAVLWDSFNGALSVTPLSGEVEPLVIYLPEGITLLNLAPVVQQYEEAFLLPVHLVMLDPARYADRLRAKLLAGDRDFDIFVLSDPTGGNLLDSVLRYGLYAPLENYPAVNENFSRMFPGVAEMMSNEGRLFGVPYSLLLQSYAAAETLSRPVSTLDDIWALCDMLAAEGGGRVVISDPHAALLWLRDFAQMSLAKGQVDRPALLGLLTNIKKYYDASVLFDESVEKPALFQNGLINFSPYIIGGETPVYEGEVLPRPSLDGRAYHLLGGCLMVNPKSGQKAEAANFLALLTSEENLARGDVFQDALLSADLTKHEKFQSWNDGQKRVLSHLPGLYENAAVYTFDVVDFTGFVRDNLLFELISGDVSPKAAADAIAERLLYTYFE